MLGNVYMTTLLSDSLFIVLLWYMQALQGYGRWAQGGIRTRCCGAVGVLFAWEGSVSTGVTQDAVREGA